MAKIHGVAGEWARVKGTVYGLWPLFLGVFAAGFSSAFFFVASPLVAGVMLITSLVWLLASLARGFRRIQQFFKGARGEERVSGILSKLPDGYHVFNDFVAGREHVDHVVIGPAGVFAVETKCWSGEVTVEDGAILLNGELPDRSPILQVVREAAKVRHALVNAGWNGLVTPVVAFASDSFVAHRANINGTIVINANELAESFVSSRVVIPPDELCRIVSILENNQ